MVQISKLLQEECLIAKRANITDRTASQVNKTMQDVKEKGMRETVHVLVTTYAEPAVMVRECVLRLLVAPEPTYMEKVIYVCDDGHSKSEGPKKKAMVKELRVLGSLFSLCVNLF